MKQSLRHFFFLTLLFFSCLFYFYKGEWVGEFPQHIHAWAQADRYAISLGFIDNGFDFFHPQTLVLNPQFLPEGNIDHHSGITSVDFPIHEYIIACLMKLSGNHSPLLFQLYYLLFNFCGLYFLLRLLWVITKSKVKTFFFVLAVFTSPIYLDYMNGFLTATSSLSILFFALWKYADFYLKNDLRSLYWATAGFSAAALCRTPFAIFLLAAIGQHFLFLIRKRPRALYHLYIVTTGLLPPILYFLYNLHLRNTYGSMYLNHFLPPASWEEVQNILSLSIKNWGGHYYTKWHYVIILTLLFISVFNRKLKTLFPFSRILLISTFGALLYGTLMLRQWVSHDYYFLETFFPVIILSCLWAIQRVRIPLSNSGKKLAYVISICFALIVIVKSKATIDSRNSERFYNSTYNDYLAQKHWLENFNIDDSARFLLPDGGAPNLPLLGINKKGYVLLKNNREKLEEAFNIFDFDYLLIRKKNLVNLLLHQYPEARFWIEKVAVNERFALFRKRLVKKQIDIESFLKLKDQQPVKTKLISFDNHDNISKKKNMLDHSFGFPAPSAYLSPEEQFMTLSVDSVIGDHENRKNANYFLIEGWYFIREKIGDARLVMHQEGDHYQANSLFTHKDSLKHWQHFLFDYYFPPAEDNSQKVNTLHFFTPGASEIWIDNISIKAYQMKD